MVTSGLGLCSSAGVGLGLEVRVRDSVAVEPKGKSLDLPVDLCFYEWQTMVGWMKMFDSRAHASFKRIP